MISRYFWAGLCSPRSPNGSLHLSAWLMTVTRLSNNDGDNWLSHHHCQVWRSEGVVRWEISPQLGGESTLPVLQHCSTPLSSLTRVLPLFWAALLRKPSNLTSTRTHTSTSTTSHVSPQTVHFFILPFTGNASLPPWDYKMLTKWHVRTDWQCYGVQPAGSCDCHLHDKGTAPPPRDEGVGCGGAGSSYQSHCTLSPDRTDRVLCLLEHTWAAQLKILDGNG